MIYLSFFIYILAGIIAGVSAGLFGVGGGLVVVPALFLVFSWLHYFPDTIMQHAIGTSLAAMVFTSASSAWAHYQKGGIQWHFALYLIPGIVLGAILGAWTANSLPSRQLEMIFGIFVFAVGCYFLVHRQGKNQEGHHMANVPILIAIGVFIGWISSLFGIGGGIVTVPILTFFRVQLKQAISTSALTGFAIAFVGALAFLFFGLGIHNTSPSSEFNLGYINVPAFICIGIASSLAAPLGAKFAYALHPEILAKLFGIYLLIVGVVMVVNSF